MLGLPIVVLCQERLKSVLTDRGSCLGSYLGIVPVCQFLEHVKGYVNQATVADNLLYKLGGEGVELPFRLFKPLLVWVVNHGPTMPWTRYVAS